MLKVGVPQEELWREIAALQVYDGDGACRVLQSDVGRGAMLLEQVTPGEILVGLVATDDDQATRIGASVLRRVARHRPEGHDGRLRYDVGPFVDNPSTRGWRARSP